MYGAALFRFREKDFLEVNHYGGISPAWPLQYDTLEPYYTKAEHLYHVHGKHGVDPTGPPTSAAYPHAPLPYEPLILDLEMKMKKIGLQPFPLPMGVKLPQDFSETETPVVLENFDGFPDPSEAKVDAHTCGIRSALKYNNVTLLTNAKDF